MTKINTDAQDDVSTHECNDVQDTCQGITGTISDSERDSASIDCKIFLDQPLPFCQSNRFPNKNKEDFQGLNLFGHAVDLEQVL